MGQEIRGVPQDPSLTGPAGESRARDDSIGRYLAGQRRLRGVSIDDLAAQTRIPRRSLERLEDGAFDRRDDGFSRGFVRTVAAALGLDAEDAVMRLLDEPAVDAMDPEIRRLSLQRWSVAAALLLSGTAAIFGIWALRTNDSRDSATPAASEIVYRRDAVRELAGAERAFGAEAEPLASRREGHSD